MGITNLTNPAPPSLSTERQGDGAICLRLSGRWTFADLAAAPAPIKAARRFAPDQNLVWDLLAIDRLDSASALQIWQAWGETWPSQVRIKPEHRRLFTAWELQLPTTQIKPVFSARRLINGFCTAIAAWLAQAGAVITLFGQFFLDLLHLLRHPGDVPWQDIHNTVYEAGVRALGITALVGFLIGIVLSYLSALQLKIFGAEIYIIDILGMSIIRELGPLLAAILVAGRSGSAMTAQIGIMRVTEELDALSAMGISHSLRLVLPKVVALTITMPLLSIWTNAAALFGGMVSAQHTLDIGSQQFFDRLPDVVPLANLFIGLGKSAVFGFLVAMVACHFGFKIKPNTESLGNETTKSVVAAITAVIMSDAVFAILFMDVGLP